jgi:hypothetical protein
LAIFIATLSFPFIWMSWHGGGGADMRYFLPVLPALSILCGKLFHDFWRAAASPKICLAAGILSALFLTVAWTKWHPSRFEGLQQIASTYVLVATALAAAIGGLQSRVRPIASGLAVALGSAGFALALQFAAFDLAVTLEARAASHATNQTLASFPARSLIFSRPEWMAEKLPGNGSIVADSDTMRDTIDAALAGDALDAGYRVFIVEYDPELTVPPGFDFAKTSHVFPRGRAIELRRSSSVRDTKSPPQSDDSAALHARRAAVI